MLSSRIEHKWIESFVRTFTICKIEPGATVAIVSESTSRQQNVQLAELALLRMNARPFHLVLPSPPQSVDVPVRSSGASDALTGQAAALAAMKASTMVVDLTIEGLLHSREAQEVLAAGSRILYVSNEHPEILERLGPDPALKNTVARSVDRLRQAKTMRISSPTGTDLSVNVVDARIGGGWGAVDAPGQLGHWPGGLVAAYPMGGAVNGTVVLSPGDINLTFKRYLETPVVLTIETDQIVSVEGDGLDAQLMRSYFAAWNDDNAYYTSHLGWGVNPTARWDSMTMYDRGDHNGVEQRAFAGNFLFSTGANKHANRYTLGHFDIPMKNCTVLLDDSLVVREGVLQPEFV